MKWGIIFVLMTLVLLTACGQTERYNIRNDGSFTAKECNERGLNQNSLIMIESKYCGHCQETKPLFLEAAGTVNINPELIDVVESEGMNRMEELKLSVQYTPTFIIGCNYYVGVQEDYGALLP